MFHAGSHIRMLRLMLPPYKRISWYIKHISAHGNGSNCGHGACFLEKNLKIDIGGNKFGKIDVGEKLVSFSELLLGLGLDSLGLVF